MVYICRRLNFKRYSTFNEHPVTNRWGTNIVLPYLHVWMIIVIYDISFFTAKNCKAIYYSYLTCSILQFIESVVNYWTNTETKDPKGYNSKRWCLNAMINFCWMPMIFQIYSDIMTFRVNENLVIYFNYGT